MKTNTRETSVTLLFGIVFLLERRRVSMLNMSQGRIALVLSTLLEGKYVCRFVGAPRWVMFSLKSKAQQANDGSL